MISIAMATYNAGKEGGKYFRKQIESIFAQTLQDFEVVVCDDCSTDSTWDLLNEYAAQDNRFRIYRNEVNLGIVKNFEKAISLCKGNLIALSDQDDIWLPNHLEILSNTIGDKMLACGNMLLIDADDEPISKYPCSYLQSIDWLPKKDADKAYSIIYFFGCFLGQSIMFKRDFVKEILPIPKDVHYHDFWFTLVSCFRGGMNFTEEIVTKYRRYKENHSWTPYQRQNRVGAMLAHLTKSSKFSDRPLYMKSLKEKLPPMSDIETKFIRQCESYYDRSDNWMGRFFNLLFEIKHFRKIYRCKHNILIQSVLEVKDKLHNH